nr:MAG TPA: hypothetical protein [Caudoviricetes sp.]
MFEFFSLVAWNSTKGLNESQIMSFVFIVMAPCVEFL